MAENSTSTRQALAPADSREPCFAFCPMWAYSRCIYSKVIRTDEDEKEWRRHMRAHFREDPQGIPFALRCWFGVCPHSQSDNSFKSETYDEDHRAINFAKFLGHTLQRFEDEPWLNCLDVRYDDIDMLMTAWLKNEVWDAPYTPQIPEKHDERLPKPVFDYFAQRLVEEGYDPTRRDLISYDEVEQEARARERNSGNLA